MTSIWIAAAAASIGCGGQERPGERAATTALVYAPATRSPAGRENEAAPSTGADRLRAGMRCRIHLRRDAAGLAGGAPVSIVGTSLISERASVSGTIERVDPDAIILRGDGSTYWIPRDVILAVEFPDERRP